MRLVILGEALLDIDVDGTAGRLAPDAPVPVLDDTVETARPGGAALAAAMAASDGFEVTLITPLADDEDGARLRTALPKAVDLLVTPAAGGTPAKCRYRADGQNLMRLDRGGNAGPWTALDAQTGDCIDAAIASSDAILVSDYGRGVTADPLARAALARRSPRTPLVWDPHPRGAEPVEGTWLFTPNAGELMAISHVRPVESESIDAVAGMADETVRRVPTRALAVTLGAMGALLSYGEGPPQVFTAPVVAGGDPCGAGDRFASAAAGVLARGGLLAESVAAAVAAASEFVAHGGAAGFGRSLEATDEAAAPVEGRELAKNVRSRGGTVVATGGCFDLLHAGHIATLQAARRLGDCLIVCLNADASVSRLKGVDRPLVPQADRARVLAALDCVDAVVVFDEDTPQRVLTELRPHVWAKGGDYAASDLPEARALRAWQGRVVTLPYLTGRSTTALVARSRALATAAPTTKENN